MQLRLAGRLQHVRLNPLLERRGDVQLSQRRLVKGPYADEGLVQQILGVAIRRVAPTYPPAVVAIPAVPAPQVSFPSFGDLGENGEARPHVGASFGVVGAGTEHGVRPAIGTAPVRRVERGRAVGERGVGLVAHLVARGQWHEDVEGRVLDALGRDGHTGLLEPPDELHGVIGRQRRERVAS